MMKIARGLTVDYFEFRNNPPSLTDINGVFITGNEAYLRRSVIETIGDEDVEHRRIYASEVDPGRIDEHLRGSSFEDRKRVVCIIDRSGNFTSSHEDWIRERFSREREQTLPCLETPGIRSDLKIVKWLKENTLHVECSTPDEERIQKWVRAFFRNENLQVDSDAVEALIERAGEELTLLRNEMEKLALYGRNQDRIRLEDVERVVPDKRELDFFEFTDAWLAAEHGPVLRQIRQQLNRGESDVKITGGLLWAFRRLRSIIELFKMGYKPSMISDQLGVQKWIVDRTIRRFKRLDLQDLSNIAQAFLNKDLVSRTGSLDASTALELMVLGGLQSVSPGDEFE